MAKETRMPEDPGRKHHNPALDGYSGPRVVINPAVMHDDRDALCVAFNESFRVIQEINGFDPVAEPTEKQRQFFADTAYANDERMLRRTILARICTFDTSVSDPTDEQLQEAVEFLDTVMEIGAPQNEWEQRSVQRIRDAISRAVGQPRAPEETPEPPAEGPSNAATGGGETDDEEDLFGQSGTVETTDQDVADFVNSAVREPDNFGANGTVEITDQDAADFTGTANGGVAEDGTTAMGNNVNEFVASALGGPAQEQQPVQQAAAAAPQQEALAPGLSRGGSRNNILEYEGRRISQREFDRIQAKFQEGGGAQQQQAAQPVQQIQVAANDEDPLKPNNLRQNTQADSGRRDVLGRPLDDRGRVIA